METEERIFAAHVLTIAAELRRQEMPPGLTGGDKATRDAWTKAHPLAEYAPAVLGWIDAMAETIANIRATTKK